MPNHVVQYSSGLLQRLLACTQRCYLSPRTLLPRACKRRPLNLKYLHQAQDVSPSEVLQLLILLFWALSFMSLPWCCVIQFVTIRSRPFNEATRTEEQGHARQRQMSHTHDKKAPGLQKLTWIQEHSTSFLGFSSPWSVLHLGIAFFAHRTRLLRAMEYTCSMSMINAGNRRNGEMDTLF
jgi:hypothetical protein